MRALTWQSTHEVRVERVPDPAIVNPRDAIVRTTAASICGSDLHLYDGYVPTMRAGDILGHEFMGEVVDVGPAVKNLKPGDRVVVPSTIACGHCEFCHRELWSLCDNSNPNAAAQERVYGYATSGIFGYSHLFGGYPGAFAEYVRVPFADVGPVKVPGDLPPEKLVFLSDAFPTGYMAAELCGIRPGDVVAVWGCGAVGQLAIWSAYALGAERVIAIDRFPDRLRIAREHSRAETIHYEEGDVIPLLHELTGGRGPDACIDAVGMESHGLGLYARYEHAKHNLHLATDRAQVLRQAILACRKGGTVSIIGVYAGFIDKFPLGAAFNKGLTLRMGQMHGQRYARLLVERVLSGEVDPSFVVTHRMTLDEGPQAFRLFRDKGDTCMRVVLQP